MAAQDEIPLRRSGVDDAVVAELEAVEPGELAGERLARAAFGGERFLDPSEESERYGRVEPTEISCN